jgi:NAD(P)-dependent dehydrogenase (short-subunit alcohol dehydrogenase family)
VAAVLEDAGHEVLRASRAGEPRVDLSEPDSVDALLSSAGAVDAVVCCAASAPLTPLTDDDFVPTLNAKLFGQVEVARRAVRVLTEGGSITLTTGEIPAATPGSAGGALVNAGLEAFVTAAAVELPGGLRLNAVSPGWVSESLIALGMDPSDGTPVADVARVYLLAVEGDAQGQTLRPKRA